MDLIQDLTLMLLYLTSWRDKPDSPELRSWRGADWEALDALREEDLIRYRNPNKSVTFTPDGVDDARALLGDYGFDQALEDMEDWGLDLREHPLWERGLA